MLPSFGPGTECKKPRRWRVAFVSVHGDPTARPGTEGVSDQNVYVHRLAQAMARQGHEVDVYTRSRDGAAVRIPVETGYQVIQVPAGPFGSIGRLDMVPHLESFTAQVSRRLAPRRPYDLIHSHSWLSGQVGLDLAKAWGLPQMHTCHSLGAVELAAAGKPVPTDDRRLPIERRILQGAAGVIATSPLQMIAMRRFYRMHSAALEIPCGVDVSDFQPLDRTVARSILGLPPAAPILAYVGPLEPQQDLAILMQAAVRLRRDWPLQVLIAADRHRGGPAEAACRRLQALATDLGLQGDVRFLQASSPAQVSLVYAAADVAVVPSRHAPFGLTALEAMACGRPVIASRVGGLAEVVVPGECGLLVAPGRTDDMVDTCEVLLRDPLRAQRMGLRARRRVVREYAWQRVAGLVAAAYGRLLTGNQDGHGRPG